VCRAATGIVVSRVCSRYAQRFDDKRKIEEGEKNHIQLFEPGEDASEPLEPSEESFDFMRFLCSSRLYSQGSTRVDLGGTMGIIPKSRTVCRVLSSS
jgi:hypothetical protein